MIFKFQIIYIRFCQSQKNILCPGPLTTHDDRNWYEYIQHITLPSWEVPITMITNPPPAKKTWTLQYTVLTSVESSGNLALKRSMKSCLFQIPVYDKPEKIWLLLCETARILIMAHQAGKSTHKFDPNFDCNVSHSTTKTSCYVCFCVFRTSFISAKKHNCPPLKPYNMSFYLTTSTKLQKNMGAKFHNFFGKPLDHVDSILKPSLPWQGQGLQITDVLIAGHVSNTWANPNGHHAGVFLSGFPAAGFFLSLKMVK